MHSGPLGNVDLKERNQQSSQKYYSKDDAKRILQELPELCTIFDEANNISAGLKRVLNLNVVFKRADPNSISDTGLSVARLAAALKNYLEAHQYDSAELSVLLKGFDLYSLD